MRPTTVSMIVKEKITENRVWLRTLTEPQLRALACQRGIRKWATLSPKTLRHLNETIATKHRLCGRQVEK